MKLLFKDLILQVAPEKLFSSCDGCIYEEQNNSTSEVCRLASHMTKEYSLDCTDDDIIFVEHKLLTNLTKL